MPNDEGGINLDSSSDNSGECIPDMNRAEAEEGALKKRNGGGHSTSEEEGNMGSVFRVPLYFFHCVMEASLVVWEGTSLSIGIFNGGGVLRQ